MELSLELVRINIEITATAVLKEGHGATEVGQAVAAFRQQLVRMTESGNVLHRRRQLGDLRLQHGVDERGQEVIRTGIIPALVPALQQRSQRSVRLDDALQLHVSPLPHSNLFRGGKHVLDLLQLLHHLLHHVRVLSADLRHVQVFHRQELQIGHLRLQLGVLLLHLFPHGAQRVVAQVLHDQLLYAVARVYQSLVILRRHLATPPPSRSSTPCACGSPSSARP